MLEYDREKESYKIEWIATGKTKYVKRLNLRFDYEDPEAFAARVEQATQLKVDGEADIRLLRYVNEVPQAPVRPLSEAHVAHILKLTAEEVDVSLMPLLEECVEEMHVEYQRAVKYSTVLYEGLEPGDRPTHQT